MTRDVRAKYLLGLGMILLTAIPGIGSAQSLPPGKGMQEFSRMCSSCHGASTATNQRKTPAEWSSKVHDMVTRGA